MRTPTDYEQRFHAALIAITRMPSAAEVRKRASNDALKHAIRLPPRQAIDQAYTQAQQTARDALDGYCTRLRFHRTTPERVKNARLLDENDRLRACLRDAWVDLHDWCELARRQRALYPKPDTVSHCPTVAGIAQTEALRARITDVVSRPDSVAVSRELRKRAR